jgi:hypothetical protein
MVFTHKPQEALVHFRELFAGVDVDLWDDIITSHLPESDIEELGGPARSRRDFPAVSRGAFQLPTDPRVVNLTI